MDFSNVFYFIASFALCYFLILLLRRNYRKFNLVDAPNIRSSHTEVTPRVGGAAIGITFLVTWFIFLVIKNPIKTEAALLGSFFLIYLLGVFDDTIGLNAKLKFIIQFIVSFGLLFFVKNHLNLMTLLVITFFVMWIMNSFNFMDGIDFFAGVQGLLILVGYFFIFREPVFLIISCAIVPFLIFNFPPAKTFMGDAGSLPIGFLIGVSMFIYPLRGVDISTFEGLLLSITFVMAINSTFFFDGTITLIKRIFRKRNILMGHREHIYQLAFDRGVSALYIALYNLLLTSFSVAVIASLIFYDTYNITYNLLTFLFVSSLYAFLHPKILFSMFKPGGEGR